MTAKDNQTRPDHYQQLGLGPKWIRRSVLASQEAAQTEVLPSPEAPAKPVSALRKKPQVSPISASNASLLPSYNDVSHYDWEPLENAVSQCHLCPLSTTRTHTVFGVGDKHAHLMIVGEAPGAEEDKRGKPFVGQAGKLLDNMLASVGLSRQQGVFITNVLKCRPPQNRNPHVDEISCCSPYLTRQIALVQPHIILAVGRYAVNTLLQTGAPISSLRSRVHDYAGIPVIVTYHPAYLLRNLPDKFKAWQDLLFVKDTLARIIHDANSASP
jgi:DNA polymerase